MTTINIRIENDIKMKATKTLASLGLDMTSAVKMFLNQVVNDNGLPFRPTRNPAEIRAKWDREIAHALKHDKRYTDVRQMHKDILR